ncbi:MAG: putative ABC transport system permease protein [Roseibaca calidilacus]|uniref:ABC transport system permease protein n=1 Tax=Roseibaca calidilacus TaxID=1666912 RepID=A0A0P7WJP9_9RHOB|nr:ABC transporter permease [Roseibaca calidilacus]KPP90912.1 MAG: putative ABC transport system permease protein [Roseibaca calidilacus]CUX83786.1 putative ABC transport system permease protein [Roseibaca calidilacus]
MTLAALLSHWVRNKVQLAMLLAGLTLATALWSGVQALNTQARGAYATAAALVSEDGAPRLDSATGQLPQARFVELRRAGVLVSPVVEGRVMLGDARVTLLGIDPLTAPPGTAAALADGDLQGFLSGDGFAHPETLAEIGATDIALSASQAVPVGTVLVDIGTAQDALGMAGQISHLLLTGPVPRTMLDGLRLSQPEAGAELAGLTDSFHLNLTAFGALAFAVGLFIVHSAVGLAFEQRRALFRTLRSLGVSLRALTLALALELAVFALLAGLAGLALGYVMAAALLPDVAATLRGLYGAPVPGSLQFSPVWALAGLAMAFAGAALAGGQALWRLWHMPVLAPAQPRAWAMASGRAMRWQVLGAGLLAVLAIALGLFGRGLFAGFALLAAALLAAALLTPAVLALCLRGAAAMARAPVLHWFWADSRQNLPRLSLALMALMLALAANIGVGTMVASFRATFIGWLDQRLVAEMTITPRDTAQAVALEDFLAPRVQAVLPLRRVEATLAGQPGAVFAMRDHATFRDNWPLIQAGPDPWDRLAKEQGALINEQLARRAGLWPGDRVALPGAGDVPILGVYPDYGNPLAQTIVTESWFDRLYPDTPTRQLAIRTDAPAATRAALLDEFGLSAQAITDQAQAKALSLAIFERTFLITGALNVLTLSVAALALFATLVTLSGLRLVQLAPLWAMGLTVRHLAGLELARALVLAGLTMVLALPVGLMLAQVLLAVINVQAFGWRLPLQVFPADWARLALWAGLAMLAASAWPAWRLWRGGGGPLLRVFANER